MEEKYDIYDLLLDIIFFMFVALLFQPFPFWLNLVLFIFLVIIAVFLALLQERKQKN